MKKREEPSSPIRQLAYAFIHTEDTYSNGNVQISIGNGKDSPQPLDTGTFSYTELPGLLRPEGPILGQRLTPVYMLRRIEAWNLLKNANGMNYSPEQIAKNIQRIFDDRPLKSCGLAGDSYLPFWRLVLSEVNLSTLVNKADVDNVDCRADHPDPVPVRDLGHLINSSLRLHQRETIFCFDQHQTGGSLWALLNNVGVISPSSS